MKRTIPMLAAALLLPRMAAAGPADYVHTPTVEYGEREIDFKIGSARKGNDPREAEYSLGFGYGAKEWWFTELYVKYKRADYEPTKYDAIEWENKFQLTETGKYPIDVGFLVEVERPKDRSEGWEVRWGPLFQTEFGKLQLNGNLLFQRNYRADFANDTQFQYQWQAKYRWHPEFEFGLQGFGELGKWNAWLPRDERIHTIGPAVFGKVRLGSGHAIKYNAALVVANSSAAPDRTFRAQVEYEF